MNREDFPILESNIVYFDNGATTLKPNSMIEASSEYYKKYSANIHRGEYYMSFKASDLYDQTRESVKKLINADKKEEIIFTTGTTEGINMIVNGLFYYNFNKGDEIILTKSEHASLIMPLVFLSMRKGIVLRFIDLDEDYKVNVYSLKKLINKNTKAICLAGITNVIGDIRDIKTICMIARKNNIITLIDGAQMVPHVKVDVKDIDCDFLVFSAHKMCGPTGVGVLYGRYELLNKVIPNSLGGGMNESYTEEKLYFKKLPERLEAGTPNIEGVIAFKSSIDYLNKIGLDKISEYEKYLRKYLISKLERIPYIQIYNRESESGIVTFNVNDIDSSTVALFLNKYRICVRAGDHCSKMLKEELDIENTVRISLYFYNTKEEIDYLVNVLSKKNELYSF